MIDYADYLDGLREQSSNKDVRKINARLKLNLLAYETFGCQIHVTFKELKQILKTTDIQIFVKNPWDHSVTYLTDYFRHIDLEDMESVDFFNNQSFKLSKRQSLKKSAKLNGKEKYFLKLFGPCSRNWVIDVYILNEEDIVKFIEFISILQ